MENQVQEKIFRVKSTTSPPELGSAIAHAINAGHQVVLKAVGAGAVNQAVKSIPIAQSFVASYGTDLVQRISFFHGYTTREGDDSGELMGIAIRVSANI
ncbi:stage V sporulation protein S [Kitasatospora sp. NPDC052896]|uniref:stage V sporulation protein S n=1 Tax=Kitasatospora sp. NPDC052896 TaxID=3364061 RepID=UPI0037C97B0C